MIVSICYNCKLVLLDMEYIKTQVDAGLSAPQIALKVGASDPTIKKYVKKHLGELYYEKLDRSGRFNKGLFMRIDGRATYSRFKKTSCEICGKTGRLEIHHKIPGIYSEKGCTFESGDHSESNLMTLCNHCHQILHHAQFGKKTNECRDPATGRFNNV